ncbi:hypothetical protein SAMN04489864_104255 [Pedobacter insulae]|uniref:Uncharacterized protein n=1 Tax=Pedobacter insulae TaxID=414048 RepID=A0A1I2WSB1_9SPHI|nr:hypothetical protein SAMN04489864_104255 [Pedobacter insulae]
MDFHTNLNIIVEPIKTELKNLDWLIPGYMKKLII